VEALVEVGKGRPALPSSRDPALPPLGDELLALGSREPGEVGERTAGLQDRCAQERRQVPQHADCRGTVEEVAPVLELTRDPAWPLRHGQDEVELHRLLAELERPPGEAP
jgi:hypothetical protein